MHLMKRAAMLMAIAAVAGAAGWACFGGGDSLTLEEYFEELERADDEFNERGDQVFESEPASVDEARDQLGQLPDIVGDFIDQLEDIDPPEEAADAHEQAIDSGRELQGQLEDVVDEIENAESFEEVAAALASDEFAELGAGFEEACTELQRIADENEIDATLDCEDD